MTFVDGTTVIDAEKMNGIVSKINELVTAVNGGVSPSVVATPVITITGNSATIACATSGATIYYTTDGNTPTTSSTQYSSAITLTQSCTIKAIAVKSGMTNSSVASASYSTSPEAETTAILSRYTKTVPAAHQSALNTFVVALKNAGIYNKIDYLMLPFLANSSAEAVQDALGNENGTFNNSASVALADNAITPVINADIATITGITGLTSDNIHISYFTVDTPELTYAKQDIAIGMELTSSIGKVIGSGNGTVGFSIKQEDNNTVNWMPSEVASYKNTAKTHVVNIGGSGKVAISVNGTYVENTSYAIKAYTSSRSARLFMSMGASATTYVPVADATSGGKPSEFKYGLFSIGKALTQTEAIAFNNAVTALMNVIFA